MDAKLHALTETAGRISWLEYTTAAENPAASIGQPVEDAEILLLDDPDPVEITEFLGGLAEGYEFKEALDIYDECIARRNKEFENKKVMGLRDAVTLLYRLNLEGSLKFE